MYENVDICRKNQKKPMKTKKETKKTEVQNKNKNKNIII